MPGKLFIVATPIGNLADITFRAREVLTQVDVIACEDTRVTAKLLTALDISKPLVAIHEHTTPQRMRQLMERLEKNESVALVSDAGTPGLNDPGGKLVALAFAAGIVPVPIPGPSAVSAAISVCGFPMSEFCYLGFAPHKKGRQTFFREISTRPSPSIFFESTHRIVKTLAALHDSLDPKRLVFVGRELTKLHESLYRGPINEVSAKVQATSLKGEFVIIIAAAKFT